MIYETAVCRNCSATFLFPFDDLKTFLNDDSHIDINNGGGWFIEKGDEPWQTVYWNNVSDCCSDPDIWWEHPPRKKMAGVVLPKHWARAAQVELDIRPRTPML